MSDKTMLVDQLITLKAEKLTKIRERNIVIRDLRVMIKECNDKDFQEAIRLDNEIKKLTQK